MHNDSYASSSLSKGAVVHSPTEDLHSHTYTTLRGMLSSLAQTVGLGSLVPQRPTLMLAVLLFWAPGKLNGLNLMRTEITLGACLGAFTGVRRNKNLFFRFQSRWKQPERICPPWATDAHACRLNSQKFFCWLWFVADGAPDLAETVSASLEELGVVDSATVQYEGLVTTIEGSL